MDGERVGGAEPAGRWTWSVALLVGLVALAACRAGSAGPEALDSGPPPRPEPAPRLAPVAPVPDDEHIVQLPPVDIEPPALSAVDPDGVAFRFWTYLGSVAARDTLDQDTGGDFNVVMTNDGQVILVEGTSIFDGAESYSTWQLTEEGQVELMAYLLGHPLIDTGLSLGSNDRAYALDLAGLRIDAHPNNGPISDRNQAQLHKLSERLRDPSWLSEHIISGPEPWVPSVLAFVAKPGLPASIEGAPADITQDPHPWPVETPVAELGQPTVDPAGRDALAVCLTGDDAVAAWALVEEDVNHAYIPVDDGQPWTLTYQIRFPGYRWSPSC